MDGNVALDLDERGSIDERLGLGVDGIGSVRVGDGSNRLELLLFLAFFALIVELDVALERRGGGSVVGRALFHLLLLLGVLLFVRRGDDAPAASPWNTSAEADSDPGFGGKAGALENDIDVVESLALAGNEGTSIGLLEGGVLVHGEADAGGPLDQGVVRVEVEEVSVAASGRDAENVLQRLLVLGAGREGLDLVKMLAGCDGEA